MEPGRRVGDRALDASGSFPLERQAGQAQAARFDEDRRARPLGAERRDAVDGGGERRAQRTRSVQREKTSVEPFDVQRPAEHRVHPADRPGVARQPVGHRGAEAQDAGAPVAGGALPRDRRRLEREAHRVRAVPR